MTPATMLPVGRGWMLLAEGTPLQEGDGFLHPDFPNYWTDYVCRPDIFRGCNLLGIPKNETAHTFPWRRKVV